jgi:hypothetical protein
MATGQRTAEEWDRLFGGSETITADYPLIEITFDPDNPDAGGPSHFIVGNCQYTRWGNALIAAAVRRSESDPDDWRFDAKPGERFVIVLGSGSVEGARADVKDKHALVLTDGAARHTIPWDAIQNVTTTGSPICA